jgi:hypothetical protein
MTDSTWNSIRSIGRQPLAMVETKRRFGALIRTARGEGATWTEIAFAARKSAATVQKYSRMMPVN